MLRKAAALAICIFISATVSAQPSLDQLQKADELQHGIDAANQLIALIDRISVKRNADCVKAFGHASFCHCINESLPASMDFQAYVSITTRTKEENEYASLDQETRTAYDRVTPIRDRCVASMNRVGK